MPVKYRKVDPCVWNDEKFIALGEKQKLSWLYLLTGPDANAIGLYYLSRERMAKDVGFKRDLVDRAIFDFAAKGMACWDPIRELIWLPNWIDYNMPSGTNQARGYIFMGEEYLPHRFAVAFLILAKAVLQCQPGEKAVISLKQAVAIREDVRCAYCKKDLIAIEEYELDHVVPKSKGGGTAESYGNVVASCRECNQKKGAKTGEEFGYPFIAGKTYSIGEALIKLIRNGEVRARFANLYHGLPSEIDKIEEVADLFEDKTPLKRISTPFERRRTPSERRPNAVGTQEQEQEQEQEAGAEKQEQEAGAGNKTAQKGLYAEEESNVFLQIPLIDKTEFQLTKEQIKQWSELYPAIDVEQHCRNYLGWAKANPEKRKTRRGIMSSINTWLQDKQNNPKYHKTHTGSGAQNEQPRPRNPHDNGPDYEPIKR